MMDLSNPSAIILAFIAGVGFLFVVRLVWSLIKHSLQIAVLAGAIMLLTQQGYLKFDHLKDSRALDVAKRTFETASLSFEKLYVVLSHLDLQVATNEKAPKQSLAKRIAEETRPDYNQY